MSLVMRVEFLRGVYESGAPLEREGTEWPPHPARVFCALVAAADSDDERDALRWLERQDPPEIRASSMANTSSAVSRVSFVPLNEVSKKSSSYHRFPARKAGSAREWSRVSPSSPVVTYAWRAAPAQLSETLDCLAARVPYIGRSTSPVVAQIGDDKLIPQTIDVARWTPDSDGLADVLSVPRANYFDDLVTAHEVGMLAWEVPRRSVAYRVHTSEPARPDVVQGTYGEFIVLPFKKRAIAGAFTLRVTSKFREALESHLDGGPEVLRGFGKGQQLMRQQVAILALPNVGFEHSTGDFHGLAVAFPRDIEATDRKAVVKAIVATMRIGLTLGALGVVEFDPAPTTLRALDQSRWERASKQWVSVTPISANRHLKSLTEEAFAAEVARSCVHAGLPEPREIVTSRFGMIPGSQVVPANYRVRHIADRATPSFHARITFEHQVSGPIVLGNLRNYGLGLMLPESAKP